MVCLTYNSRDSDGCAIYISEHNQDRETGIGVPGRINTYCMTDHYRNRRLERETGVVKVRKLSFSVYMKYAYKRISDVKAQTDPRRTFEGRYRQQQN